MPERRTFVGVRLSTRGLEQLRELATQSGITLSEVIRLALKHGLPAARRELGR